MLKGIAKRLLLGAMIPISLVTFIPNIMLSDPGTKLFEIAFYLGLAASASLFLGGAAGLFNHPKYMPIMLSYGLGVLGLVLQTGALLIVSRQPGDKED